MLRALTAICAACTLATAALSAEITLRNDLVPRLEQLRPIYDEPSNFGWNTPVVAPGVDYWNGLRVIMLSGVIEQGDAARLEKLIGPEDSSGYFTVVLNSPGGNFLEGVAIGEFLSKYRGGQDSPALNGVIVLKEHSCLSACAVAFSLAALPRDSGRSIRFVERGAKLGFHMPFFPEAQQKLAVEVAQTMDVTYEIMSKYLQLIANGIAPPALVQNALYNRRADAFFMLDGGAVTRFMNFVPVAGAAATTQISVSGLTQGHALAMCKTLTFSAGRDLTAGDYEYWGLDAAPGGPDETPLETLFQDLGSDIIATRDCLLQRQEGNGLGISSTGDCGFNQGWCVPDENSVFFGNDQVPRATGALLGDTLGCHGGKLTDSYYVWDGLGGFLEEEEPGNYPWYEGKVPRLDWSGARLTTDLNIRETPGGARLGRLTKGNPVQVLDCQLSADGQGVWYKLQYGVVVGWGSARYVKVPALSDWDVMIRPAGRE